MADWRARAKCTEPEALVFATWSGKPISPNNVLRQQIFPACEALGLQRVKWLTLRRTYSSWAHEKGVPGKVVALLMGHFKVDTERVHAGDRWRAPHGGRHRIRIVHNCSQTGNDERVNSLKRWLVRLDSNQQPSG